MRLLIIEDYEEDAVLLRRHLSRAGYAVDATRVQTAAELTEALAGLFERMLSTEPVNALAPQVGARSAQAP